MTASARTRCSEATTRTTRPSTRDARRKSSASPCSGRHPRAIRRLRWACPFSSSSRAVALSGLVTTRCQRPLWRRRTWLSLPPARGAGRARRWTRRFAQGGGGMVGAAARSSCAERFSTIGIKKGPARRGHPRLRNAPAHVSLCRILQRRDGWRGRAPYSARSCGQRRPRTSASTLLLQLVTAMTTPTPQSNSAFSETANRPRPHLTPTRPAMPWSTTTEAKTATARGYAIRGAVNCWSDQLPLQKREDPGHRVPPPPLSCSLPHNLPVHDRSKTDGGGEVQVERRTARPRGGYRGAAGSSLFFCWAVCCRLRALPHALDQDAAHTAGRQNHCRRFSVNWRLPLMVARPHLRECPLVDRYYCSLHNSGRSQQEQPALRTSAYWPRARIRPNGWLLCICSAQLFSSGSAKIGETAIPAVALGGDTFTSDKSYSARQGASTADTDEIGILALWTGESSIFGLA